MDSQHGTLIEGSEIQPTEFSRTHSSPAYTDFLSLIFARLFVRALNAASCAICYIQQIQHYYVINGNPQC